MIEICNRLDKLIQEYERKLDYDKSWAFTIAHAEFCSEKDKKIKALLKQLYWVRDGNI